MSERPSEGEMEMGGKRFENLESYVRGFLAAVRTHRRLTGAELEVTIEPCEDLPLAQRILLR